MVIRSSVEHLGVEIGAGVVDEAIEEIGHQFRLQIAHQPDPDQVFINERWAAAQIDRADSQRLIHGQHKITGAIDAFAIAQCFGKELPDDNADVFDRVMLIDIQIAFGLDFQVEGSVLREELEHVVEEANAG